jgi:hypothetical protein
MPIFLRFWCLLCVSSGVWASENIPTVDHKPSITERAVFMPGFLPLYWDAQNGRLYGDIEGLSEPFIYYNGLSQGVGSNDLGLDRGRLGDTHLVQFDQVGDKVFLTALNTKYVARSNNAAERRAVDEAFAQSIIWGFSVMERSDATTLIDLTDFALSDATQVSQLLAASGEGSYAIDPSRSAVHVPDTKAFPDNTEIDARLTYAGNPQGSILRTVVPDASAVTVHSHHSFVRLPDEGYEPLPFDPRAGYIDSGESSLVYDYASPIDAPIKSAFARRHRLEKMDPNAEFSESVKPIVYWVDSGAPEPVRTALIEGALWWNEAFAAAGYIDAFQVKVLPDDVDPMDVRYNVIQWVHRSTRGWSYGSSVRDPRTQEILKGHVTLGSLRVRQDYLIAEGLLAPYEDETEHDEITKGKLREFALARIRQLSAHEVGHTLGLAHNFAASADGRASVMDYPHPLVTLDETGEMIVSDAYDAGIGEWDKRAIIWGYQDFSDEISDGEGRAAIIGETIASGLHYVADEHARVGRGSGSGPVHPRGSLWDNGADPVIELNRMMALRETVLSRFSINSIQQGRALATIEDVLVPTYLMHRYQIQAAATVLGGQTFTYAMRGDGQTSMQRVNAEDQRAALSALLATLEPRALLVPDHIVSLIPPRPPQSGSSRELFPRSTGYVFDPMAAVSTAAKLTLQELLDHKRAARMNNQNLANDALPNFADVLAILINDQWPESKDPKLNAIERKVQTLIVDELAALLGHRQADSQVRADALKALINVQSRAKKTRVRSLPESAHFMFLVKRIDAYIESPEAYRAGDTAIPPGSPI